MEEVDPLLEDTAQPPLDGSAWQRAFDVMVLNADHFASLQTKRGFSAHTIEQLKFRSSHIGNRGALLNLSPGSEQEFLKAGIFRETASGIQPERQLCGFGSTGKKDADGELIWADSVNPIIIPYLDEAGKITYLRPHKGNIRRPSHFDEFDDTYAGIHPYCPFLLRSIEDPAFAGKCVITEGEYKAAALWQCGIPSIAMPGIQSMRNPIFRRTIIDLLTKFGIREVVVIFDNESKDDASLPSYKPDPFDRYDTVVYAKYTAASLRKDGFKARIGNLPNDWRVNGKADWDGALAQFVAESNNHIEKGTAKARKEFLKVITQPETDAAGTLYLFPTEAERIIEAKLARLYHHPKCEIGDEKTRKLALKIQSVEKNHETLAGLSRALLACSGGYFVRRAPNPNTKAGEELINVINAAINLANEREEWSLKRALQERLKGTPIAISNFIMTADFTLINCAGKREYLVRVRTTNNEKTESHVRIGGDSLSQPVGFREWCLSKVGATWAGGGDELNKLTMDIQARTAHRQIFELDTYGYCDDQKFWKFGNIAYTTDGKAILPDKNNVFWHDGFGYQTDFDPKNIGTGFEQKAPMFDHVLDESLAKASFEMLTEALFNAIGDFDGLLALGTIVAYFAHPELLKKYGGTPGLWLTGKRGGGKSTIAEWLMKIWGFKADKPIGLTADTTNNFVARELAKYGCLPVWLDEYRFDVTRSEVNDLLKNAFNRTAGGKAAFDQSKRTRSVRPETMPLVSGESSTTDAATRSRYINVTVLEDRSRGDGLARLKMVKGFSHNFQHLGHYLIKNRPTLVPAMLQILDDWVEDPGISKMIPEVRQRWVSGVPYAAWLATATAFNSKGLSFKDPFKSFAISHAEENRQENRQASFSSQFWINIITMLQSQAIPAKYFIQQYAKVSPEKRIEHYGDLNVDGRDTQVMFIAMDIVHMAYEQEMRKANKPITLGLADLKREVSREKYWIRAKENQAHKIRIGDARPTCWCIDLVLFPHGEEFQDFFSSKTNGQTELHN